MGTAAAKNVPASGNASTTQVVMGNDTRLSDARTPTAHNQASNTINVMTGYSRPTTGVADIYETDSLNTAIGKLEYSKINSVSTGDFEKVNFMYHIKNTDTMIIGADKYRIWQTSEWSDKKIKTNIKPSQVNALNIINKLQPKEFDYIDKSYGTHKDLGFIAQDIEQYIPEAILECPQDLENSNDSIKTLAYEKAVPYLIKAVQELSAKVDSQQQEIEELKARL